MTDITDTLEENSASDIVADAKAWLVEFGGGQRLQTHSGNCHKWHSTCLVSKLTREIERLRTPATHATPTVGSVQGEGTLSKPLYRHPLCQDSSQKNFTLTDEEREALKGCTAYDEAAAATLRNLLERLT